MRRTIQNHRRHVFALCVFTSICALGSSSARAFAWQDPQQPDSCNSNSGVPAEKPAPTAAEHRKSARRSRPTNRYPPRGTALKSRRKAARCRCQSTEWG
jgi:hypothetical protein